ncbi:MAG: hypothetical protein ACTHMJ_15005, partial [Thermomicrobiales bacterium]
MLNLDCLLDYGSGTVQCVVTLRQSYNGAVSATIKPPAFIHSLLKDDCYIESVGGSSLVLRRTKVDLIRRETTSDNTDSLTVRIGQAELVAAHEPTSNDPVIIRMHLTNLPFTHRWNERFTFNAGAYSIAISPRHRGTVTHVAEIVGISYAALASLRELMEAVCWLLSLATGRLIGVARVDAYYKRRRIYSHLGSLTTALNRGLPLVLYDMSRPDEIINFIEHSLPFFQQESARFPLNNLINIGLLAKHTIYVENQALLMTNFLEVVRYNYALNVGVPTGLMKQQKENFIWLPGSGRAGRAYFADILEHFCNHEHLTGWKNDFKELRNHIVHTGVVPGTF